MKTQLVHDEGTPRSAASLARAPKRARRWSLLTGIAALSSVLLAGLPAFADPLHVKDVKVSAPQEGAAEVLVSTTGAPRFTARVAEGGLRLIIDIESADVAGASGVVAASSAQPTNSVLANASTEIFEMIDMTRGF